MWAALKSPLLIGADLRTLTASALTILNNPAIIALSQDPLSRPAVQIRRDLDLKKDEYGVGEAQVWSGPLAGGDQLVIFLNAAGEDLKMEASLVEIFYHDGPNGHAPQVEAAWTVLDLWADRMSETVAKKILDASTLAAANESLKGAKWYNATETPYNEGLMNRDSRLLGKDIGTINPRGSLKATVKKHSAEVFRLTAKDGKEFTRWSFLKDEL